MLLIKSPLLLASISYNASIFFLMVKQIVDDSDPAVNYSNGWQKAGGANEYESTTSWTNQPRRTATLSFVGIRISVMGTVGPSVSGLVSPQSNYSIDGGTPTTYTANQDQGVHYNTKFFESGALPDGKHILVVTNLLASDSLYLDSFLIDESTAVSSSLPPKLVTVTLPTTVLLTTTQPSLTSPGTGLPTGSETPSSSGSNTAAIAGSFFGAAVFIVVAFAIIIYLRGRNKRNKQDIDEITFPKVLEDREPMPPFGHTAEPYGTSQWGTQEAYNIDTAQPHYPVGMDQQAQNGTYNGDTAQQQHYAVDPPSLVTQRTHNGAYDPYGTY